MATEKIALADVTNHTTKTIREIAGADTDMPGALLPILHAVQDKFGYLPEETVATVWPSMRKRRWASTFTKQPKTAASVSNPFIVPGIVPVPPPL